MGSVGLATLPALLVGQGQAGETRSEAVGSTEYAFSSGTLAARGLRPAQVRAQVRMETGLFAEHARMVVRNEIMRQGMIAAKAIADQRNAEARAAQQRARAHRNYNGAIDDSNDGSFLDCVRHRESRGQYGAVNSSSGAAGAYQFMQGTWNNIANASGRTDLVGVNPASASPADQDSMAQQLYAAAGEGPWSGGSYEC